MPEVQFYREEKLPFEMKVCDTISDLSYKKHSHEEYSLGIVDVGESSFWCEGQFHDVRQKTLVFIPHSVIHACNPNGSLPWKYKMVYVQSDWVEGFMRSQGSETLTSPVIKDISQSKLFREFHRHLRTLMSPVSFLEKEASLLALFERLGQDDLKRVVLKDKNLQPKLQKIKEYIHTCFLEKITLDQLEEISGLNKYLIIRSFNQAFSIPPHMYQTLLRVNYAKRELRKSRPIIEVACEAGFYDQSHFHKAFKNQVGATPEQYQNGAAKV